MRIVRTVLLALVCGLGIAPIEPLPRVYTPEEAEAMHVAMRSLMNALTRMPLQEKTR